MTFYSKKELLPYYSVPQGSCAGPVLYVTYASTLEACIASFNVNLMEYADDHTAYSSFPAASRSDESNCMENLQACLNEVRSWMSKYRLKMNDSKTEAIMFGNRPQLKKCISKSVKVGTNDIELQSIIKYLGVDLDEGLNFKKFVQIKCRKAA